MSPLTHRPETAPFEAGSRWRKLLIWGLGIAVAAAAVVTVQFGWRWLASRELPTGDAEWIWARTTGHRPQALAFYAGRDFEVPADWSPSRQARLLIQADQEYLVTLNARSVGSNQYQGGSELDVYDIGSLLLPGANRLLVEVRSGWGRGGLLACLQIEDPAADGGEGGDGELRPLFGTDSSWTIAGRYRLGLERGWVELDRWDPGRRSQRQGGTDEGTAVRPLGRRLPRESEPVVWGKPPTGRWGTPQLGPTLPALAAVSRGSGEDERIAPRERLKDLRQPAVLHLDWGRPETGYLVIQLSERSSRLGLAYLSLDAPRRTSRGSGSAEAGDSGDEVLLGVEPEIEIISMPGKPLWRDSVPRRFRTASLYGLDGIEDIWIEPVHPERRDRVVALGRGTVPGIFDLAVPPHRTPVRDAVHRAIGGFPGRVDLVRWNRPPAPLKPVPEAKAGLR